MSMELYGVKSNRRLEVAPNPKEPTASFLSMESSSRPWEIASMYTEFLSCEESLVQLH